MAAFGPDIGVALAGLASQPQLPPTSAAHKWFQKKNWQKAVCFGHFALAIQETLIYAGGGGSGGRGKGPQTPERFCACQVSLRPQDWSSARRAGRPATTAIHKRRKQMLQEKTAKTLSVFNILRVHIICACRAAFGLHIGVALAELASQFHNCHPQATQTNASRKNCQNA